MRDLFESNTRAIVASAAFAADDVINIEGNRHKFSPRANRFCVVADGFPPIVGQLAQAIYDRFYVQPDLGRGPYRHVPDRLLEASFVEEVGSVVKHTSSWQQGWSLVGTAPLQPDHILVRNGAGAEAVVARGDFDDERGRRGPATSSTMQRGYFHVFGEHDRSLSGDETVRIYFNPSREGALPLTALITSGCDDVGIGYHYKILDNPQSFGRADGAVLYIAASDVPAVAAPLRFAYDRAGHWLKNAVPRFTKPLAPGVGFAADPGTGESFGMHRGRLVAEGLWAAHTARVAPEDIDSVLPHVAAAFERNGVSADRPYLNRSHGPEVELAVINAHRALEEAVA